MWSSVTAAGVENGPAPPSRSKHSATLLGGHVYLLGGRNGNLPLKDLWRYSLGEFSLSTFLSIDFQYLNAKVNTSPQTQRKQGSCKIESRG